MRTMRWMASMSIALTMVACGKDPLPSAAARDEAARIWRERCVNCHGDRGLGDGEGAKILPVRPRALTDSGWQSSVTDEHIATVIVEGGPAVNLSPLMAANPDLRTKPEVIDALVRHIRDLAG
jgi:mono/diheme cytochrome c family protein